MTDWNSVPVFGDRVPHFRATIRPSAYGIISDVRSCVAVVRTPSGVLLPGGGRDDGESAEATVIRETAEECALVIVAGTWRAAAIEHVSSTTKRAHFEKRSTFCDAIVVGRSIHTGESDHELVWVSPSEAMALLTPASHRWAVGEWLVRVTDRFRSEHGTQP